MVLPKLKIVLLALAMIFLASLLLAGLFYFRSKLFESGVSGPVAEINGSKFIIEISDDPEKRSKGLGSREELCDDCGMVFLFDKPGYYSFWMKDMKFALDFIWIAGDKIIDIDENIPPDYSGILKPETPVDKVLEVNAGVCGKYKIEMGDEIKINLGLYKGE